MFDSDHDGPVKVAVIEYHMSKDRFSITIPASVAHQTDRKTIVAMLDLWLSLQTKGRA